MKIFQRKIVAYQAYFQTNKPYVRYGTDKIRVLTVVEGGQTRLENLKRLAEKSGGEGRFWFLAPSMMFQVATS